MNDQTAVPARKRQVGRFTLIDLAQDRAGAQIWRAIDTTLNREVALWMLPVGDERVADLEEATRTASAVPDRRITRILDVFRSDDWFVVVTEWANGQVLSDHLQEPLPATQAARIAYELARALESAHASGIAHGLIRPRNILVADDGEVRLTGLGIDAVLSGIEPSAGGDPVRADIHGIGAILYACLTARWPDREIGDLPSAPEVGGHVPPPSRILADVPESLDDICARTVTTIVAPRGRPEVTSVAAARELLGSSLTDLTGARSTRFAPPTPRQSALPRTLVAVGAILAMLFVGWFGFRMMTGDNNSAAPQASASKTQSPTVLASPKLTNYRIAAADDFDPLGNNQENPGLVQYSHDGNLNTQWRTVTYFNKGLDKPGVGLLFDLGAPRSVSQVKLHLVGNGTDLQVLASTERGGNPKDFDLMAQATQAGDKVTLKSPKAVSARYVLIWFTGLPQVNGGWRGGVREAVISG